MSYALKTTGLAANCVLAVFVDDDGTTVKDIKTGATGTLENNGGTQPTIATGTWDGASRKYGDIPARLENGIDFGTGNLGLLEWATSGSKKLTFVAFLDDYAAGVTEGRPRLVGTPAAGDFVIGRGQYGNATLSVTTTGNTGYNVTDLSQTNKQAVAIVCVQSQNGPAYYALDTDSAATALTVSQAAGGMMGAASFRPRHIGRHDITTLTSAGTKLYGFTAFNKELTQGEFESLIGDPWSVLFEAAASAPTITDAGDESFFNGETGITITGTGFGTVMSGSAGVVISPSSTDPAASGAIAQTETGTRSDTSVTFTAVKSTLSYLTTYYLFVKKSDGTYNAAGYAVQLEPQVYIRETLVDLNSNVVSDATGLTAFVWRTLPASNNATPAQVLTGLTTNGSGVTNWQIARGALSVSAPIWVMIFKDGTPFKATARKITPVYE